MKTSLHILYLEDEPNDVELVQSTLAAGGIDCHIVRVETREEFIQSLDRCEFDLILGDYRLPAFDGIEALEIAKEKCPDTPFIFVTGTMGEETAIETLKSGATDYVMKQRLLRLVPVVKRALKESAEQREKKQAEEKIRQAATEWRETFDSMPYGVMLIDADLNITRANQSISALFGVPLNQVLGKKCHEIVHNGKNPIEECPLPKLSAARKTAEVDFRETRMKKHFQEYGTIIYDDAGTVKGYILSLLDITEAKEKEKKLLDSRNAFFNMLKETDFAYKELQAIYTGLIHAFVNAIDAKSPWTKGHSERVTHYSVTIAKRMGIKDKDIEELRIAALLHDIGKIGTYDTILDKPDRLTDEEFALVKMHPAKGADILKPVKQLSHLVPVIRHHHERIDGRGYPHGLKGDEIPLGSRIVHIADSFDSMTADRPYRPAPGMEYAISELRRCAGTQFDAEIAGLFAKILEGPAI